MKNISNTIKIYLMALWFTVALAMTGSGNGEFTTTNFIGVAAFAAFAIFSRIADRKGWVKINESDEA